MKFPYLYRKYQKELIREVSGAVKGGNLVLESGTGSGKTVCVLYSSLRYSLKHGKKIVYLVRTNSQQRQVILEMREIGGCFGLGIQGRHAMCPLARESGELRHGTAEELSQFCKEKKSRSLSGKDNHCSFFLNMTQTDISAIENWTKENLPTAEEFYSFCVSRGICPYEMNKLLVADADLVTCPYIYFFHPQIRESLLGWMGIELEDVILIVDEAHNLPEYCREIRSSELSLTTIEMAKKEIREYGDISLAPDLKACDFCELMKEILLSLSDEYVIEEDGVLPPSQVKEELLHALTMTSHQLRSVVENLITYGEVIREAKRKKGKLPRSYAHRLGNFVSFWLSLEPLVFAKLVYGGENPKLEGYCLDASLASKTINDCHASIHMSGTLSPMQEYRDGLALEGNCPLIRFPNPFPPENLLVLYVDDVSTRYDDLARDKELIDSLKEYVLMILSNVQKNTVIFFPSYNLLEKFLVLRGRVGRPIFVEEKALSQEELMRTIDKFKISNGILYAVVGGRVAEGLDFPDEELEVAVLVGIPYPKPTAKQKALRRFYDKKLGKGWDYTVVAPTTRRLLQSIGRLVRKETDRGVAVILDRRARRFARSLDKMERTDNVVKSIKEFFSEPSPALVIR